VYIRTSEAEEERSRLYGRVIRSGDIETKLPPIISQSVRCNESGSLVGFYTASQISSIRNALNNNPKPSQARAFAVLGVCRQIYVEASPLICSLNTFRTDDPNGLLSRMLRGQFEAVRTIQLYNVVSEDWWAGIWIQIPSLRATFLMLKLLKFDRALIRPYRLRPLKPSSADYLRRAAAEGVEIVYKIRH
jgi:hypothetical protein